MPNRTAYLWKGDRKAGFWFDFLKKHFDNRHLQGGLISAANHLLITELVFVISQISQRLMFAKSDCDHSGQHASSVKIAIGRCSVKPVLLNMFDPVHRNQVPLTQLYNCYPKINFSDSLTFPAWTEVIWTDANSILFVSLLASYMLHHFPY